MSTQNQLELINKFSKVALCKINVHKSVASLYLKNKLSERDSKNNPIKELIKMKKEKKITRNKFNLSVERSVL